MSRSIFLDLSDEEWTEFKLECVRRGTPMGKVVTDLVREHVKSWKEKSVPVTRPRPKIVLSGER